MKNRITLFRSQSALVGVLALGVSVLMPSISQAEDWLNSIQDARCDPEDIEGVTGNVRNAIEASVRRAEMTIQAPTPVGDLGCLNDLMTAPLDTFSNVGGLLDSLMGDLGDIAASGLNLDIDVSGMICGFAAEKFATLTSPLSEVDKTMSGFASLASSSADRVSGTISSAFSNLENGTWDSGSVGSTTASHSYTGVSSTTDSSGYSGSIANYTPPDVSASDSDVQDVNYTDTPITPIADNSDAWNEYNQRLMHSLGQYIGCRVAGELDGTHVSGSYYGSGTWNVPGSLSDCSFNPGNWPSAFFGNAAPEVQISASPRRDDSAEVESTDRVGGQDRNTGTPPATGAEGAPDGSPTTIWDMLGK
ncbi:hypothetical protein KUV57_13160 [Epibacterium sp. DP7N7-1]|nr:hypothetical protein [Epibacterium sp. DP7N7-1]